MFRNLYLFGWRDWLVALTSPMFYILIILNVFGNINRWMKARYVWYRTIRNLVVLPWVMIMLVFASKEVVYRFAWMVKTSPALKSDPSYKIAYAYAKFRVKGYLPKTDDVN